MAIIQGTNGNDILTGGGGDDRIIGSAGDAGLFHSKFRCFVRQPEYDVLDIRLEIVRCLKAHKFVAQN